MADNFIVGLVGYAISFFALKVVFRYLRFFNSSLHLNNIQNIHNNHVPRIGGVVYLFSLSILVFLMNYSDLYFILMFIPLGIVFFIEDMIKEIPPKIRLSIKFIGVYFIFYYSGFELPNTNISFLDSLLNNFNLKILFYTFATTSIMNGFNMIDGTNGLSLSLFFIILLTIFFKSLFWTYYHIDNESLIDKYFYFFFLCVFQFFF